MSESLIVCEITGEVIESLFHPLPNVLVDLVGGEFLYVVAEPLAKLFVVQLGARDANDCEIIRQQTAFIEIVESGNELALGQVSRRAEDDHDAGCVFVHGSQDKK